MCLQHDVKADGVWSLAALHEKYTVGCPKTATALTGKTKAKFYIKYAESWFPAITVFFVFKLSQVLSRVDIVLTCFHYSVCIMSIQLVECTVYVNTVGWVSAKYWRWWIFINNGKKSGPLLCSRVLTERVCRRVDLSGRMCCNAFSNSDWLTLIFYPRLNQRLDSFTHS